MSALFTALYDHMPVYTAEPSAAERAAAATLLDAVSGTRADVAGRPPDRRRADVAGSDAVPAPRTGGWDERVPA